MSKFCKEINLILHKLKNGDKSKQKVLFDATYNHLKIIALKYASDKNDYEDILMETYLRAFRYIKNFDMAKDGYNWLCKIVQNVAKDFNGKTENNFALVEITHKDESIEIEDIISDRDILLKEIGKLPELDKKILYLRFWKDYTLDQIADEINRPKSSIHKRILILFNNFYKNLK